MEANSDSVFCEHGSYKRRVVKKNEKTSLESGLPHSPGVCNEGPETPVQQARLWNLRQDKTV